MSKRLYEPEPVTPANTDNTTKAVNCLQEPLVPDSPLRDRGPIANESSHLIYKEKKLDLLRGLMARRLDKIQQAKAGPSAQDSYIRNTKRLLLGVLFLTIISDPIPIFVSLHEHISARMKGLAGAAESFNHDSTVWIAIHAIFRSLGCLISSAFVLPDILRDKNIGKKVVLSSIIASAAIAFFAVKIFAAGSWAWFSLFYAGFPALVTAPISQFGFVCISRVYLKKRVKPLVMNAVLVLSQMVSLLFAVLLSQHWQGWSSSKGCQPVVLAPKDDTENFLYVTSTYICSSESARSSLKLHGNIFFMLPLSTIAFGLVGFLFIFGFGCEEISESDTVVWDPVKIHQKMASVRKLTVKQVTESLSAVPKKKKTEPIAEFDHDQDYELRSHSFTSSDNEESILQSSIFPDKSFQPTDLRKHGKSIHEPQSAIYSKPSTGAGLNLLVEQTIPEEEEETVKPLEVCDILCSRSALFLFVSISCLSAKAIFGCCRLIGLSHLQLFSFESVEPVSIFQSLNIGLLGLLFPIVSTLSSKVGYLFICQSLFSLGVLAGFWLLADSTLGILILASWCLFYYFQTLSFIYSTIALMTDKIRLQIHLSNLLVLSVLPAICLKYLVVDKPSSKHQDTLTSMTILEVCGQLLLAFSNPKLLEKLCSAYMISRGSSGKHLYKKK